MIRLLKNKDLKNFIYYCQNRDNYSDFYITKNNKRIFLNNPIVAKKVFNDCIKRGEKCYVKEEGNEIKALLLIIGYKEKDERKYLKILTQSKNDVKDLFSYLIWQKLPSNIFIKVHKKNINFGRFDEKTKRYNLSYAVRKAGFRVIAVREREVLLKKEEYRYDYKNK
jgi:hypothetical protein